MQRLEYVLAFRLYVDQYGHVEIILSLTIKRIQKKLQVICMAAQWIHLWFYLLPMDQRELMVIRCNRLLTVAQNFFFRATGWRPIRKIENG
jgi:hypothetical protein